MNFLAETWSGLTWSPWVPFSAERSAFHEIPAEPGVYRIRPADRDLLMYIGETGRSLHQRLRELRMGIIRADLMPWSDPHAEAPALWAWHDDRGCEYECSAAPLDASPAGRKGMESYLLYRYRQEFGHSPLCNFGHFHPRYRQSSDRKAKMRGGRLEDGQGDNPAGAPGIGPLEPSGKPGDPDWMDLEWTSWQPLAGTTGVLPEKEAGLFLLADNDTHEILRIGHAPDLGKRLGDLAQNSTGDRKLAFSFQVIGPVVPTHILRELETDLVGNFFEYSRTVPELQFKNR